MKLTFALTLTPLPINDPALAEYTVTAESPVGRAQAQIKLPFTEAEIADILALLSRSSPKLTRAELEAAMRDFGGRLFRALIGDPSAMRRLYDLTLERAGIAGIRLLITLAVQPGRPDPLLRIPFELLHDPERDFLALSRATPVVRGRFGIAPRPPADVTPPLRVLVVIASPEGLSPLDVEAEWSNLNMATRSLQSAGLLTLVRLEGASAIAVQRRFRAEDFHVIHFIGHSDYDPSQDQGVLILEREDGTRRPQLVTAEQIGRELGEETGIRLVVLNTCRSGQPAESDALRGLATNLALRGIPAVVAMQFPISDSAARSFSEEFYRALADFMPIDEAVSEGRRAIVNRGIGLVAAEWVTPVLYLRTDSAALFRPSAAS
ncbi:MAG: CHAT domain-containing protein, partial [Anaerolinea sp.]|nr:CHAT domain-containing protein [Anaerolinea sp.]